MDLGLWVPCSEFPYSRIQIPTPIHLDNSIAEGRMLAPRVTGLPLYAGAG